MSTPSQLPPGRWSAKYPRHQSFGAALRQARSREKWTRIKDVTATGEAGLDNLQGTKAAGRRRLHEVARSAQIKAHREAAHKQVLADYRRSATASRAPSLAGSSPRAAKVQEVVGQGSCFVGAEESRWIYLGGLCWHTAPCPVPDCLRLPKRIAGLEGEAQGTLATVLAELCPEGAPPLRVCCAFGDAAAAAATAGRAAAACPTAALVEFRTPQQARQALVKLRDSEAGGRQSSGSVTWRHCGLARSPGEQMQALP
eukprot:TRINITY_DN79982_c0_g1_i1.p1 TRINITY_DN79982_c0_g1~~TRINITY_DN79982_c0_g1_i1.p1  ORF type:complete len:256 (-),score=54.27 TRINITY_DN79982_c0_g1_i1:7-774(-)